MNASLAQRTAIAESTAAGALLPWLVRSVVLGQGRGGMVEAAHYHGAPPEMVSRIKSTVPANSLLGIPEIAGNSGAALAFLQQAGETSVLARILAENAETRVPLNKTLIGTGADASAWAVGDGAAIPVTNLSLSPMRVPEFKVAAIVVTTRELWENTTSAGQAFVENLLRQTVARAADRAFFGRALAPPTVTTTLPPTDTEGLVAAMRVMLDTVHTRPGARLHWALTTSAANLLATMPANRELNPFGGTILNIPATITSGIPGRRLALLDARGFVGNLDAIQVTSAEHVTLQMSDDPENDAAELGPAQQVSMWQTNSRAARVTLVLGLEKLRDDAIAVLDLTEAA